MTGCELSLRVGQCWLCSGERRVWMVVGEMQGIDAVQSCGFSFMRTRGNCGFMTDCWRLSACNDY